MPTRRFPIFGEHSEFAARAALASKPQGKYWDFHVAMMKERRVTKDNVLQIAERVGIDVEKLKVEMAKPKYAEAIQKTQQIATSLGIEGTPGFIVDDKVSPGYVPSEQLKAMVADVRKNGCKIC
jgi:protein-disulfide isomerase